MNAFVESIWLVFRSWVRIPVGSWIFSVDFSLSQQKHPHSWVSTDAYSKKHQASEFHHLTWIWLLGLLGGLCVTTGPLTGQSSSKRVRIIWNSAEAPIGNAAYVACLPLFCQGSERLNGKNVWLVFRRSWVWIPAGSRIFSVDVLLMLSTKTSIMSAYFRQQ